MKLTQITQNRAYFSHVYKNKNHSPKQNFSLPKDSVSFTMAKIPGYLIKTEEYNIKSTDDIAQHLDKAQDTKDRIHLLLKKDRNDETILSSAIQNGNMEAIKEILSEAKKLGHGTVEKIINKQTGNKANNALMNAIELEKDSSEKPITNYLLSYVRKFDRHVAETTLLTRNINRENFIYYAMDDADLTKTVMKIAHKMNSKSLSKEIFQYFNKEDVLAHLISKTDPKYNTAKDLVRLANVLKVVDSSILTPMLLGKDGDISILDVLAQRAKQAGENKEEVNSEIFSALNELLYSYKLLPGTEEKLLLKDNDLNCFKAMVESKNAKAVNLLLNKYMDCYRYVDGFFNILYKIDLSEIFDYSSDEEYDLAIKNNISNNELLLNKLIETLILKESSTEKIENRFTPLQIAKAITTNVYYCGKVINYCNRVIKSNPEKEKMVKNLAIKLACDCEELDKNWSKRLLKLYAPEMEDVIAYLNMQ